MKSLDPGNERFNKKISRPPVLRPRTIHNVAGVRGTLPLKPGEVILTPAEEKRLRALGWKTGDPLPGDLPERLAIERENVQLEIRAAKPPQDHPVLKVPEPIDISNLSPQRRQEVETYLQQFKEIAPQIEEAARTNAQFQTLTPGVQKALQEAGEGIEVVDSRRSTAADFQRRIDEAEGKATTEPDDGLEEDDTEIEAVVALPPAHCPHCGHDMHKPANEPAAEDLFNYGTAILGQQPFCKRYELLQGRLVFVFCQPNTQLAEMALGQIAKDLRLGLLGEVDSSRQLMIYRAVLSLESLQMAGERTDIQTIVRQFLSLNSRMAVTGNLLANLVAELIETTPLKSESIWRLCRNTHARFDELLTSLEARAPDEGF